MADNFLIIIPNDPDADIGDEAAEAACVAFDAMFPGAEEVSYDIFDEVRFIDPGVAFTAVNCPKCGKDADAWWPTAMDKAARLEFDDLDVVSGCCKAAISLNDMTYQPAAGFARFALVGVNVGAKDLSGAQRAAMGALIGCDVRIVVQRG